MRSQQASAATPKTLIIFSHPYLSRSRINAYMLNAVQGLPGVAFRHIDALYPDGKIDVKAEQLALEGADNIVFQFPTHWYSVPGLLKIYLDEVLLRGWAYGPIDGAAMALTGKTFRIVSSAGSTAANYTLEGLYGMTYEQMLVPLKMTAIRVGMLWREHLILFDTRNVTDEELEAAAQQYRKLLSE